MEMLSYVTTRTRLKGNSSVENGAQNVGMGGKPGADVATLSVHLCGNVKGKH